MGIFFKVLATKHAIFKFYGSSLREAINTVKLRVVAVTHGDDPQIFSCRQKKPSPLPKFVWKGLFHSLIYQTGLVGWLGRCSATAVFPGSIPNDPVKI